MKSKKEWLIDRAESMLAVIESEIAELQQRIERRESAILQIETKFREEEADCYIALMDQEENEEAALKLVADLKKEHDKDKSLVLERTLLEREQLHLIALRQDREIYLFYLKQNEEEQQCLISPTSEFLPIRSIPTVRKNCSRIIR